MIKKYLDYQGLTTLVDLIKQRLGVIEDAIGKDERDCLVAVTDRIKAEAADADYKEKDVIVYTFTVDEKTFVITSKDIMTGKNANDIVSVDGETVLGTLYPDKTLENIIASVDTESSSDVIMYSIRDQLDEILETESFAISKVERINDSSYYIEATNGTRTLSTHWTVSDDSDGNTIWTSSASQIIDMIGFETEKEIWSAGTGANSAIITDSGNIASGSHSIAIGKNTKATNANTIAEGLGTIAAGANQVVAGKYNIADTNSTYAFVIGGGSNTNDRKNIFTVDWNGNISTLGNVYITDNSGTTITSFLSIAEGDTIKIATKSGNILQKLDNNELYVPGYVGSDSISIEGTHISTILSKKEGNALSVLYDGLYVAASSGSSSSGGGSGSSGECDCEKETEDIDWTEFKAEDKRYIWQEMEVFKYVNIEGFPWTHYQGGN